MGLDRNCKHMADKDLISDFGFVTQRSDPETAPETPPSAANGEGIVCPQCGTTNPPGSKVCKANPKCGSFLPSNQAARTTGLYARSHPPALREQREELIAGLTSDLGGASELS